MDDEKHFYTVVTYDTPEQLAQIKAALAANPHFVATHEESSDGTFPTIGGHFTNVDGAADLGAHDVGAEATLKVASGLLAPLLTAGQSYTAKVYVPHEPTQKLSLSGLKEKLRTSKLGDKKVWLPIYKSTQEHMERLYHVRPSKLRVLSLPTSVLTPLQIELCNLLQRRGHEKGALQKLVYLRTHFGDVWPTELQTVASSPTHDAIACCWGCGKADATLRKCGGCNTARYCSKGCSEHHWSAGHNKECKAHQRGDAKTPLRQPVHIAPNLGVCASCGSFAPPRRCADCNTVAYCNKKCQRAHWCAGHKSACSKYMFVAPPKPAPAAPAAPAAPVCAEELD